MKTKVSFHMIGGFLGAGKTASIRKYVDWLRVKRGLKAAVITNDQAECLVDSELMEDSRIATAEIGGGCFCCQSDLLMKTADRLVNDFDPDVIIAEPVGSCTDLIATVSLAISTIFHKPFTVAPLTVLLDPLRAERVMRRAVDGSDLNDIDYIYLKQMEEAQVIVVNKKELLVPERMEALKVAIESRFPSARVFIVSVRKEEGLEDWWEYLHDEEPAISSLMEVDYRRYADGEAKMGWVNAGYRFNALVDLDFNNVAKKIADDVVNSFSMHRLEVAHFKVRVGLEEHNEDRNAAVIQWVDNEQVPEFTAKRKAMSKQGRIMVNMRAESEPQILGQIVHEAVSRACAGITLVQESIAAFSPSAPNPLHRVSAVP